MAVGRRDDCRDRDPRFGARWLWAVGNRATAKCEIVTSNPAINAQVGGNISAETSGSEPDSYQSFDDAKLARSNVPQCPAVEEPPAQTPDDENKSNQSRVLEPFRVQKTRRSQNA